MGAAESCTTRARMRHCVLGVICIPAHAVALLVNVRHWLHYTVASWVLTPPVAVSQVPLRARLLPESVRPPACAVAVSGINIQ
jgi:hypothetical protein